MLQQILRDNELVLRIRPQSLAHQSLIAGVGELDAGCHSRRTWSCVRIDPSAKLDNGIELTSHMEESSRVPLDPT